VGFKNHLKHLVEKSGFPSENECILTKPSESEISKLKGSQTDNSLSKMINMLLFDSFVQCKLNLTESFLENLHVFHVFCIHSVIAKAPEVFDVTLILVQTVFAANCLRMFV
jgi:hypothetical protein